MVILKQCNGDPHDCYTLVKRIEMNRGQRLIIDHAPGLPVKYTKEQLMAEGKEKITARSII